MVNRDLQTGKRKSPKKWKQDKATLTAEEMAEYLDISLRHVWRLKDLGRFPGQLEGLGRCVRWHKATIDDWMAAGCPKNFS